MKDSRYRKIERRRAAIAARVKNSDRDRQPVAEPRGDRRYKSYLQEETR